MKFVYVVEWEAYKLGEKYEQTPMVFSTEDKAREAKKRLIDQGYNAYILQSLLDPEIK